MELHRQQETGTSFQISIASPKSNAMALTWNLLTHQSNLKMTRNIKQSSKDRSTILVSSTTFKTGIGPKKEKDA